MFSCLKDVRKYGEMEWCIFGFGLFVLFVDHKNNTSGILPLICPVTEFSGHMGAA